ncbi:hypothetical protein B0H16DRAFT_1454613 [Mycena metata]|uniref:Uncharacterized protein n=1 Tax=Mycena metata TaxID=1033252 RepID=A0AAD7NJT4_9AGAR|nr:hypothetical protein B0H16DRAFT_1454613 [Mycena metata]
MATPPKNALTVEGKVVWLTGKDSKQLPPHGPAHVAGKNSQVDVVLNQEAAWPPCSLPRIFNAALIICTRITPLKNVFICSDPTIAKTRKSWVAGESIKMHLRCNAYGGMPTPTELEESPTLIFTFNFVDKSRTANTTDSRSKKRQRPQEEEDSEVEPEVSVAGSSESNYGGEPVDLKGVELDELEQELVASATKSLMNKLKAAESNNDVKGVELNELEKELQARGSLRLGPKIRRQQIEGLNRSQNGSSTNERKDLLFVVPAQCNLRLSARIYVTNPSA